MPNHYSDMGFLIERQEDISELLQNLYETGTTIPAKHGEYRYITVDNYIEFWLQIKKNNVLGLEFHYSSKNTISVKFEKYIKNKNSSKLGGSVYVWNEGNFPMILDVPNLDLYRKIKKDSVISMQISAYTNTLSLFDSKEDYDRSQEENKLQYASECFVPIGMFTTDKNAPPEAYAMLSGTIKSFEKRANSISNKAYYYFEVECLGIIFDIVADTEYVSKEPVIGGVLNGEFWLSGKML